MLTPPNAHANSDFYLDILKRMTLGVHQKIADMQLLEILQQAFEKELAEEKNIVLSRAERNRLFRQVIKVVLTDLLAKLDSGTY